MISRTPWIEDAIFLIEARKGLFTLAQMRKNHLMEFYSIRSDQAIEKANLNDIPVLFCIFVSSKYLRPLFHSRVTNPGITPNLRPIEKRMLSWNLEAGGKKTADLIELSHQFSNLPKTIIKKNLSLEDDIELFHKYEFCGMHGNPEKIRLRLIHAFDLGLNWDEEKSFLFPTLPKPKATQKLIMHL